MDIPQNLKVKVPEEYTNEQLAWIYDFEYTETYDVPFYIECARRFGSPVLELGSGTGRVSIPLLEAGFEVFGIEASPLMLELCRQKLESKPFLSSHIQIIEEDMADFDLGRTFPLLIIPINTLLLLDYERQLSCLKCCSRHLTSSGALVIDVFHPFSPSRALHVDDDNFGAEKMVSTRPHPQTGNPVHRYVTLKKDIKNQLLYIINTYEERRADRNKRWGFVEKLRFVHPVEMELMLGAAGMQVQRVFGWYDGRPFEDDSEQMIFVAQPRSYLPSPFLP